MGAGANIPAACNGPGSANVPGWANVPGCGTITGCRAIPGWTMLTRLRTRFLAAGPSVTAGPFLAAETLPVPPAAATLAAQVADRPSLREWLPPSQVRMLAGWRPR